jgi:hypothetical protein
VVTTTAIKVTAVVSLIAITGAATGAWYVRRGQLEHLVNAAEAVDEVIDEWHTERAAILADLPSAHYRTPEVERQAAEQLERMTVTTITSLDAATTRVRRVRVTLPWNAAVAVARDSYLHHVDRWAGYLARIAEDPVAGLDEPPPPFTASRAAAARALGSALPPFAGDELRGRITALLTR